MQGLSLGGLVKAMTTEYPLTVTFERGANWITGQYETLTASLIGNMIRFNYFLYRSSDTGDGNLVNEEVCTITFNHGGKVKSAYNTSFSSGSTGSVATFGTSGMTKVKDASGNETDSITFKVNLAATGGAAKSFSGFFFVPVTLNLNNY